MRYLADTSAVWRILRGQISTTWQRYAARGMIAICDPVEAELMRAVRADADFEPFFATLRATFPWCPALDDPWQPVITVQRELLRIGHHRGPSPIDILVALSADVRRMTVLHADRDFESIRKVRPGIPMTRIDEPES